MFFEDVAVQNKCCGKFVVAHRKTFQTCLSPCWDCIVWQYVSSTNLCLLHRLWGSFSYPSAQEAVANHYQHGLPWAGHFWCAFKSFIWALTVDSGKDEVSDQEKVRVACICLALETHHNCCWLVCQGQVPAKRCAASVWFSAIAQCCTVIGTELLFLKGSVSWE